MNKQLVFAVISLVMTISFSAYGADLISSLDAYDSTSDWSVQDSFAEGLDQYGDRDYKLSGVPSEYVGSEWIRTANDTTDASVDPVARFTLLGAADVYVAFDDRQPAPSWMSDWQDTGDDIINSEPESFSIYKKYYNSGSRVELGNTESSRLSMYTVFVISADSDGDGIPDNDDNCPNTYNPGQEDWNDDGEGDVCDDSDGDGTMDAYDGCITDPDKTDPDRKSVV